MERDVCASARCGTVHCVFSCAKMIKSQCEPNVYFICRKIFKVNNDKLSRLLFYFVVWMWMMKAMAPTPTQFIIEPHATQNTHYHYTTGRKFSCRKDFSLAYESWRFAKNIAPRISIHISMYSRNADSFLIRINWIGASSANNAFTLNHCCRIIVNIGFVPEDPSLFRWSPSPMSGLEFHLSFRSQ